MKWIRLAMGFGVAVWLAAGAAEPGAAPSVSASLPAADRKSFDEAADAPKEIAAALAKAKADGRHVLLDFGANWCPDCVVLARLFKDEAVRPFLAANFHVVKVNVGRQDQNQELVQKYGNPVEKGIPAVVVLDAQGRMLAATKGGELANARSATAAEILTFLRQWAPKRP